MDQLVATDPFVKIVLVVESGEEYSSLHNPPAFTPILVHFPPSRDSTFHFSTEGHLGAKY